MDFLKSARFGGLFTVTFAVAASFQIAMGCLGLVLAFLSPELFKMNGAPADNPLQAIGVVLFLVVFSLVLNAGISAVGALIWLGIRRVFPRSGTATESN